MGTCIMLESNMVVLKEVYSVWTSDPIIPLTAGHNHRDILTQVLAGTCKKYLSWYWLWQQEVGVPQVLTLGKEQAKCILWNDKI